jgi:hypothetical protein
MEPRIYVYKMTTDNGGAPCVWKDLLSLAICKGQIRSTAEKGSLIFGFSGKEYGERLLYIAEVTDKLDRGKYYWDAMHQDRPDCIYKKMPDGTACLKEHAQYHSKSKQLVRDVGMEFERADVLLSTDFRYFGKAGTCNYTAKFPAIKVVIEHLTQGHRVNHEPKLYSALLELKLEMWQNPRKIQGKPTSSDQSKVCNSGPTMAVCK